LGVFGLLAYLTGDDAGKMMETYPGITEDIIEPHENLALFFFMGLMVTSAMSLVFLYITMIKKRGLLLNGLACILSLCLSIEHPCRNDRFYRWGHPTHGDQNKGYITS